MLLGTGRILKQESKRQITVRTLPGIGPALHKKIWKPKELTNDQAPNQFNLLVGSAGSGKTNLSELWIDQLIEKHMGFMTLDAAGMLRDYTIRRCAAAGWPAEKFYMLDFYSPYGYGVHDFLEDDPDDAISAYQITEEFVSATAQISTIRSTPGARELDLSRMCVLPLILQHKTLADLGLFIADEGYREEIVRATEHPDLARFWLGKDSYFRKLGKDVLESLRNKFNPLILHPAIRRVIDQKGSSMDLFEFMQSGGVICVDLSEDKLKLEIRQTIAQLIQYWVRLNVLKRQRVKDRPLFMCLLDEFPQYKTTSTIDLTRIARQLGLGILFLCQDLGIFSQEEYRALTSNCATLMAMNCSRNDATDMAHELFLYSESAWRDWEETKNLSAQEEMNARIGLLMQLAPGQMIARVKPSKDTWLLDVPEAKNPQVSEKTVQAFLKDMAKHYYRKPSRMTL